MKRRFIVYILMLALLMMLGSLSAASADQRFQITPSRLSLQEG